MLKEWLNDPVKVLFLIFMVIIWGKVIYKIIVAIFEKIEEKRNQ